MRGGLGGCLFDLYEYEIMIPGVLIYLLENKIYRRNTDHSYHSLQALFTRISQTFTSYSLLFSAPFGKTPKSLHGSPKNSHIK